MCSQGCFNCVWMLEFVQGEARIACFFTLDMQVDCWKLTTADILLLTFGILQLSAVSTLTTLHEDGTLAQQTLDAFVSLQIVELDLNPLSPGGTAILLQPGGALLR